MSLIRPVTTVLLSVWLAYGGAALGQADLFDAPATLFGEQPVAVAGSTEAESESPLTRQLNERAGRGELQLANSIQALARTGQWADVDRLLSQVSTNDAPTLAEMARSIGAPVLLQISRREKLSERARGAIAKLNKAAVDQAESQELLRKAIDQLDADSVDDRLAGARALLAGGDAAIAELVAAAVAESPPAPRDDVLRTMLRLGDGGTKALRQLALYGQPAARQRALAALARIDRATAVAEFITALHATGSTDAEVATAQSALQQLTDRPPNLRSTINMLFADLQRKREAAAAVANSDQAVTLWSVNDEGTAVQKQPTREIIVAYRDAADAAQRIRRVGGNSPEILRAILAADLSYRVMIDPDWGDPDQVKAIRDAYGEAAGGAALSAAIAESLERGDTPTLVGLLRLIDDTATDADRDKLLRSNGPTLTPLVRAVSAAEPRIRYEAAEAIMRLSPTSAYAGSSRVMRCLSEMRALADRPTAILVETRSEVIQHQETLLSQLGFNTEVVGSVAELMRVIARGGDLRMIVSKTELVDVPPIELIDLVRRTNQGSDVPIVFFGGEAPGIDTLRWSAPTVLIGRPVTTAAYSRLVELIERQRRLPPLTAIDRSLYRRSATELLKQLAQAG